MSGPFNLHRDYRRLASDLEIPERGVDRTGPQGLFVGERIRFVGIDARITKDFDEHLINENRAKGFLLGSGEAAHLRA